MAVTTTQAPTLSQEVQDKVTKFFNTLPSGQLIIVQTTHRGAPVVECVAKHFNGEIYTLMYTNGDYYSMDFNNRLEVHLQHTGHNTYCPPDHENLRDRFESRKQPMKTLGNCIEDGLDFEDYLKPLFDYLNDEAVYKSKKDPDTEWQDIYPFLIAEHGHFALCLAWACAEILGFRKESKMILNSCVNTGIVFHVSKDTLQTIDFDIYRPRHKENRKSKKIVRLDDWM